MTPADLYRTCKVSACRLETLQVYGDDEDERQRAFLAGGSLPPPGPGKVADLKLIASLRQAGRVIQRVHIVARPLSDYMRYELAAYAENVAAGEDVRIADLTAHPELADWSFDFALFDAGTPGARAMAFHYNPRGMLLGHREFTSAASIEECAQRYAFALARSVSLDEFMAAVG
jgi:hypothetical protein